MDKYYVGIDTSNYTTSLAVIDAGGNTLIDLRKILEVKKNQVGLRQQDAIFQHMKNLPLMIDKLSNIIDPGNINTISVSVAPRTVTGLPSWKLLNRASLSRFSLLSYSITSLPVFRINPEAAIPLFPLPATNIF